MTFNQLALAIIGTTASKKLDRLSIFNLFRSMAKVSLSEAVKNSEQYRIRVFKNDFLEKLSYVHPIVPLIVYAPIVAYCTYNAFYLKNISVINFAMYFLLGIVIWTLAEYFLHRFVFHPPQTNAFFRWLYFYAHGIHHEAMNDATRLVLPPGLSLPLAYLFFLLYETVFPGMYMAVFTGFMVGYLIYDYLHFASHFYALPYQWFKAIKKNHMRHHNVDHHKNFGFTSPLFDIIFGTYLKIESKEKQPANPS